MILFKLNRGEVADGRVESLSIVKHLNPLRNRGSSNDSGRENPGMDELGFQGAKNSASYVS